jgi:hypothetical protein
MRIFPKFEPMQRSEGILVDAAIRLGVYLLVVLLIGPTAAILWAISNGDLIVGLAGAAFWIPCLVRIIRYLHSEGVIRGELAVAIMSVAAIVLGLSFAVH